LIYYLKIGIEGLKYQDTLGQYCERFCDKEHKTPELRNFRVFAE